MVQRSEYDTQLRYQVDLYGTPNLVFDHDLIFDQQYLWNPKIGFLVEINTVGRKSHDGRKPD